MTTPLDRTRLTELVAAAHKRTPLEAAARKDPYLQKRLDDAATIARWEERIRLAAIRAFGQWTTIVRGAVLDGRGLTADPTGDPADLRTPLPPDPGAMAGLGPTWDGIAQATIATSVNDLLGEVFGQYALTGDGVITAKAWQAEHLATVSNRLSGVPNQTFDRIRTALQDGHDRGESIPHLRERVMAQLSPRVGGGSNYWRNRATTIARTETTGAMNGGHLAAWKALAKAKVKAAVGEDDGGDGGDVTDGTTTGTKIWVATMDERTRPSHVAADGMQVPLDKPFTLMGGPIDFPGDPSGPAAETVNCRCTMLQLDAGDNLPTWGDRQMGQDTEGFRDGVAEAADAEAADAEAAAIEADTAETSEAGDVLAEADADTEATAATRDGVDTAGVPWQLTYDYLSAQSPEALDELEAHLVEGLSLDDPLAGARWDDYVKYTDHTAAETDLVDGMVAVHASDAEITRAVQEFADREGTPGLTHPSVGGAPAEHRMSRAAVQDEYAQFQEVQYLRAEADTRGVLLNRKGIARNVDPRDLFAGRVRDVIAYGSDELLEWFETNRRVSWAEYYYERTGAEGYADRAAKAARANAGIGRDRVNPLTAAPSSSTLTSTDAPTNASLTAAGSSRVSEPSPDQLAAYQAGRAAYTDGEPSTACPLDLSDPTADPQALGLLWVRGYVFARRDALGAAAVAAGLLDTAWQMTGHRGSVTAAPTPNADNGTAAGFGPGADTPAPEGPAPMPRTWRSDPFLAPFATPTGDGRIFKVGALTARALPLPLLFQDSSAAGHDQSVVVGRITSVEFTDQGIVAEGDYLDDPSMQESVSKAIALVEAGLGGVSVDLAACTGELVDASGEPVSMDAIFEAWDRGEDPQVLEQVTAGELIATTQVATPAFAGAKITMSDTGADPLADPSMPEGTGTPVAPAGTAALDGAAEFVVVDKAGEKIAVGDIVEVQDPADDAPADDQEAATPAAAPGERPGAPADAPDTEDKPEGKTIKGAITAIDPAAETVTVQPSDDPNAEPLVVHPSQIVKVDAPAEADAGKPTPPEKGSGVGASTRPATFAGEGELQPTAPADAVAPATDTTPDGDDAVAPVTGDADLTLLEAIAPLYDQAAKLVAPAIAGLKDPRVQAAAEDLVADAAEWQALLNYGLTPDDDDAEGMDGLMASPGKGEPAGGPANPPAEWFDNPKLAGPTALTVTDDGRVFGHAATWGTCHVGYSKTCITPPPSPSSYAYFHTGEVVTAEGSRVAVGNLTLGGRHASVEASYRSAVEHYDVRGAGVAVVRMYEDEFGIAFAGALTPAVTSDQLYDLRRSPVSGDWRRVGGNLELIGVLSVNSPGFPTPRFRTDEAGRTALTAAPSVRPSARPVRTRNGGLPKHALTAAIESQVRREVAAELGRQRAANDRARRLSLATVMVKGDKADRMAALAASVDGGRTAARRDRLSELAGTVAR